MPSTWLRNGSALVPAPAADLAAAVSVAEEAAASAEAEAEAASVVVVAASAAVLAVGAEVVAARAEVAAAAVVRAEAAELVPAAVVVAEAAMVVADVVAAEAAANAADAHATITTTTEHRRSRRFISRVNISCSTYEQNNGAEWRRCSFVACCAYGNQRTRAGTLRRRRGRVTPFVCLAPTSPVNVVN